MVLHARFALVRFIQVRVRNCAADADITFSIHDDVDDDAGGMGVRVWVAGTNTVICLIYYYSSNKIVVLWWCYVCGVLFTKQAV